jgi:mannitol/fructose-specific phosphotransferase system IIA component (Ntr-type)
MNISFISRKKLIDVLLDKLNEEKKLTPELKQMLLDLTK